LQSNKNLNNGNANTSNLNNAPFVFTTITTRKMKQKRRKRERALENMKKNSSTKERPCHHVKEKFAMRGVLECDMQQKKP
jgi:hypothetical protein